MESSAGNVDRQRAPLAVPVDLGLGLQINIYCHTVIIERTFPPPTNATPQNPPAPLTGVWVRSGGILDFMRTLYQNILDRDPESQGVLEGWTRNTYIHGLAHTIGGFFTSPEYSSKGMSTEATVDKFYLSVLGRQPDVGGRAHWIGEIQRGMTLAKLAEMFVSSDEYRGKVRAASAPDPIHWPH